MVQTAAPGMTIVGRYRLERMLGEGGMGAVWAATHLVTQKQVALKVLKGAGSEEAVRRFTREARAASAVRHPNVVQIHDVLEHEGHQPVMVMDLLTGESLGSRLARERTLALDEFARIMVPILSALGTAHATGIVHRDLKPDNIFLHVRPDGELEPKVLDFGIAKLNATEGAAAVTAHLTKTGAMMGTPYYMAPEQVFGERDLDQQADVWAMGVMCYECLSGRKPFDGENVGQLFKGIVQGNAPPLEDVAPHLPQDVTQAIGRMLKREREERASDLRELYAILKRYSSVQAASFGTAGSLAPPRMTTAPELASSATGLTGLADTIRLPLERKPRWVLPLAAFGLASAGLGLFFALRGGSVESSATAGAPLPEPPPAETASNPEPAAPPEPEVRAAPGPVESAPDAAAVSKPSAPIRAPSVAAPAAPPEPALAPAPASSRIPGTVVEQVPF
jgi:eukaryotic-like serine/threonine-protein kinase